jgi:hygromycin-B 4-O-kinase
MSTVKTKINQDIVFSYIKDNFDNSISNLEFINGGEMSQAFSFQTSKGNFVIRVNTSSRSFLKDQKAFDLFGNKGIPIPKIIKIGQIDDVYFFAISEKAEGKHITALTDEEYNKTLPSLLKIMDDIHGLDIKETKGFGKWNLEGNGVYDTWKEFIYAVNEFQNKEDLFKNSFLEIDVWGKVYSEIKKLSEFCPEERFLVHGDYGNNNAVSDGEKVTGIFDWADSLYGDYLYDIAWITFWLKKPERIKEIEDYYGSKNIPNFKERLLCYKLRIGLGSLSFYAYSNQKDKYDSIKQRTLNLLLN